MSGTELRVGAHPAAQIGTSMHAHSEVEKWREQGYWVEDDLAGFAVRSWEQHAQHRALVGITASDLADPHRRAAATPREMSYAELAAAAGAGAADLAAAGVSPGEPVLLHLPNTIDFVIGLAAVIRLGALPVFALHSQREAVLSRLAAASGARFVLTAAEREPLSAELLERHCANHRCPVPAVLQLDPDTIEHSSPAVPPLPRADSATIGAIQLSGGTTGSSKLIPRTHSGYIYTSQLQAQVSDLRPGDALLVALPASHNFPMTSPGILGAWAAGAGVVMCPDPSPATAFRLIGNHRVTHLSLVPPLAQAWIEAAERRSPDLSSVRVIGIGGARLAEPVARRVESVLGGTLQQVYGMAEGLANFTRLDDPEDVRCCTQGRPVSAGDEIRIVDSEGRVLPVGEEGELQTRGPYTITRYLGHSSREQAAFTDDGFYCTGDLVRLLPDGNLQVTGRTGDKINRAGETLSAQVIEDEVLAHPQVLDAMAVGVPDTHLGEALAVVITLRDPDTSSPDLRAFLRSQGVPPHMLPDDTVVAASLPVTAVGKNSRAAVREQLAELVRQRRSGSDANS